jgi:hypothetical protein
VRLFRGMKRDEHDGRPQLGSTARTLGLRPEIEIQVDDAGLVRSGEGGLSVAYESPLNLPPHRRPPSHGGDGPDPVWEISTDDLPVSLECRIDPDLAGHAFLEPAWTMEFGDYETAIHETRDLWRINETVNQ